MEKLLFLKRFLQSPRSIGSITPSSKRLAKAIVNQVQLNEYSTVVELGAGTGVITREILSRVPLRQPLLIFENDKSLRDLLTAYENIVLFDDAFQLFNSLESYKEEVDYIISGLPLLNFSEDQVKVLLKQAHDLLKPGGKLIGFQYTPLLFPILKQVFPKKRIKFVPFNIPPAFIYICKK